MPSVGALLISDVIPLITGSEGYLRGSGDGRRKKEEKEEMVMKNKNKNKIREG